MPSVPEIGRTARGKVSIYEDRWKGGLIWRNDVASYASRTFFDCQDGGEGVDACFGCRDVRLVRQAWKGVSDVRGVQEMAYLGSGASPRC
jgi:hypothetical protein